MALTAVGPDGSYIDLGTVTSDGYYGTFSKTWTPEKERDYKIMRRSLETTRMEVRRHQHLSRSVLPHTTTTSSAEIVVPDYATALIGGFLAVIIAVAIVGILVVGRNKQPRQSRAKTAPLFFLCAMETYPNHSSAQ